MASLHLPKVGSNRGKTSLEVERENFEKRQTVALSKAINSSETPVKEKHARNAILGTFEDNGGAMFWNIASKMPVQANPIVCWKFLQMIHKLMREGHQNVVKDSIKYGSQIKDLGKLWGHLKEGYGKLIAGYCRLLIQKLKFHRKFSSIPGNLMMTDEQYYKICGADVNNYFEFSIDMLDYMDEIILLQQAVFGSLDMSRANSMTTSGQCRLAPLILCILDSCQLYDYLVKSLFHLHSSLSPDTLNGHRDRFLQCYKKLKEFYYKCSNLQYFKHLVQVPSLPESPPNFLTASDFNKHIKPVAVVKEEEPDTTEAESVDNLIDMSVQEADPFEVNSRPPEPDDRDILIERLQREIHLLKEELGRVRAEDHHIISSQKEEITRLEKILSELRLSANKSLKENEDLKKDVEQLKTDAIMASKLPEAEKSAKASQEKFQKMKDIYGKLREEHVNLLRNHDTLNKQLATGKKDLEEKEEVIKESQLELNRMKEEKQLVADNLQKSADDISQQLAETTSFNTKLEKQRAGLEERVKSMEESNQQLEADLDQKTSEITSLTTELREVRDKTTEREQDMTEEIDSLRLQLGQAQGDRDSTESRLSEKLSEANNRLSALEVEKEELQRDLTSQVSSLTSRCNQLESDLNSQVAALTLQCEKLETEKKQTEQRLLAEQEELRKLLIGKSISEAKAMIEDALEQGENPAYVSSTCTAEYLISKASPVLSCLTRLHDSSISYSSHKEVLHELISAVTGFSHHLSDCVVQGFATSHAAQIEPGEELSLTCKKCGQLGLDLLKAVESDSSVESSTTNMRECIESLLKQAEGLVPKMEDVKAEEIGDMLEKEMQGMTSAIEDAASKIQDMLHKTREDTTGVKLEVNENILGSCTELMKAIKILVEKSRDLQKEIVLSGRGTTSAKEFYKKNNRWTEGLLSAAKAVGWGATKLLEVADRVVSGQGKFEEIMACAKEIAASTAQLVVSSKVKADRGSVKLAELSTASKTVNQATGQVVASAKSASEVVEDQNLYDYSHLTLHQTKQMEMNTQIKVMEYETLLERERKKLGEMRKHHYTLVGNSDEKM